MPNWKVWAILTRGVSRRANQSDRGSGIRARDDMCEELRTRNFESHQREHVEARGFLETTAQVFGTRFSPQLGLRSRDSISGPCVFRRQKAAFIFNCWKLCVWPFLDITPPLLKDIQHACSSRAKHWWSPWPVDLRQAYVYTRLSAGSSELT